MKTYIQGFKQHPNSSSLDRYIVSKRQATLLSTKSERSEFEIGLKKGELPLSLAKKYMKLVNCGHGAYVQDSDLDIVWIKEGDKIVRSEQDLSWVDELLTNFQEQE